MEHRLCAEVRAELIRAARSEYYTAPKKLVTHIAECAICRGALMLILFGSLEPKAATTTIDCAECQDSLSGFIDLEADEGSRIALQLYPEVAAHLWTCPDCQELYQLTKAAIDAEHRGRLRPIRSIFRDTPSRLLPSFRLPRIAVQAALPDSRTMRGEEDENSILFEDTIEGYQVILAAESQPDQNWTVNVRVTPAIEGWLELDLDQEQYHVHLQHGIGSVPDVPAVVLAATTGEDLVGTIEIDH